jgi:LEA14-like dessication related protein
MEPAQYLDAAGYMLIMKPHVLSTILLLLGIISLTCGCMEQPIKEPTVTVSDISLADVSLQSLTVNTTVNIYNPNPVGAKLNKLAFDVYYLDDTLNYLGHGEKTGIVVKENGNTTVTIPVTIGNIPAISAVGSLVREGSLTLNINGSAFIDVKVTSFEKRFEQSTVFQAGEFEGLLPLTTIPGTGINVADTLGDLGGLLDSV